MENVNYNCNRKTLMKITVKTGRSEIWTGRADTLTNYNGLGQTLEQAWLGQKFRPVYSSSTQGQVSDNAKKRAFTHAGKTYWNAIPETLWSTVMNSTLDTVKKTTQIISLAKREIYSWIYVYVDYANLSTELNKITSALLRFNYRKTPKWIIINKINK